MGFVSSIFRISSPSHQPSRGQRLRGGSINWVCISWKPCHTVLTPGSCCRSCLYPPVYLLTCGKTKKSKKNSLMLLYLEIRRKLPWKHPVLSHLKQTNIHIFASSSETIPIMLCENAAPEHLINVFGEFEYFVFISCKRFGLSVCLWEQAWLFMYVIHT